jgi:hypothetical protein
VFLEEGKDGTIMYGPIKLASGGRAALAKLAPKFKELCRARVEVSLGRERVIEEILDQIERDLAVSDPANLASFLDEVSIELHRLWLTADELEMSPFRGGLRILSGINSWRQSLQRPLLQRAHPFKVSRPSETLEWLLGSYLLHFGDKDSLRLKQGMIERTEDPKSTQALQSGEKIVDAMPYSELGAEIIEGLERKRQRKPDELWLKLRSWLYAYEHFATRG